MSLLTNIPKPPKVVTKTQLKVDEIIALIAYILISASLAGLPRFAAAIFLLYALKCLKPERILFLGIPLLAIGALAKLEHWWWAAYALIIAITLCLLLLFHIGIRYRKRLDQRLIIIALILFLFSNLAKLEHWSWAIHLTIIAIIIFIGGVCYRFYLKEDKNNYDLVKLALLIIAPISRNSQGFHYTFAPYMGALALLVMFIFIILSFVDLFKNRIFTT